MPAVLWLVPTGNGVRTVGGRLGAAIAASGLGGILVAAAVLHDGVTLAYDDSGKGCRTLTDASAHDLASALLPVRLLVAAWILATGIALMARLSAAAGGVGTFRWLGAIVAAAGLAVWQQAFIGTDGLSAAMPLVGLWLLVLVAVVALALSALARRRNPVAPWLWAFVKWLLVAGGALPLALLALTTNGAIHSC